MTPEITLEDGTELFAFPSSSACKGCFFDGAACSRWDFPEAERASCTNDRDVIFLTKEKYLLRCMTEGAP